MNTLKLWALCLFLTLLLPTYAQLDNHNDQETATEHQTESEDHDDGVEDDHDDHNEEENKEDGAVDITVEQQKMAGIVVESLRARTLPAEISAPGEVKLNAYLTRKVTPLITAKIIKRHVQLGDKVTSGQPLVTLSSVEMAEAQGVLQVATREWLRVKSLGKSTVSGRRYTEAQVLQQQALSRVRAYGMSRGQIATLLAGKDGSANGTFQLLAPQSGTVIRDNFFEGEFVEPGRELFEISDESLMWVEARLTPEEALGVKTDSEARVQVSDTWFNGRVIQAHHLLDEVTRTLAVRIEVANLEEKLHPGLFVDARISGDDLVDVFAVPEDAVLRSPDGNWAVFIELSPGKFASLEVDVIRTVSGLTVIDGLSAGTRIVMQGAFFVQSEIAKSGFEIHNH